MVSISRNLKILEDNYVKVIEEQTIVDSNVVDSKNFLSENDQSKTKLIKQSVSTKATRKDKRSII